MGMFDDLRCEVPLPDGWHGKGLQTKSLGCDLDQYRISDSGALERRTSHWKVRPEEWEPIDFHGILNFYSYDGDINSDYRWHEYNAKFTDGKLVGIEQVPA